MSGVLTTSSGDDWLVAGWAWRMLLEKAMELSDSDSERAALQSALYMQGLDLSFVDDAVRKPLAVLLVRAAGSLISSDSEIVNNTANGLLEELQNLTQMLDREISAAG